MTYDGKRLCVVKVGGAHLDDEVYLSGLADFLRRRQEEGVKLILVHGGGKEISLLHDTLGLPFYKKNGLRVTSEKSMELVLMVLCGLVNKRLVRVLNQEGVKALGVSGIDCRMVAPLVDLEVYGRVGGTPEVKASVLEALLRSERMVVMAPVCVGSDGEPVNVNADVAAQAVASALGAEQLEFVTDVEAVRTASGASGRLSRQEVESLLSSSVARGGMIPKLLASVNALESGVSCVRVGNIESLTKGYATEIFLQ